MKVGILTITDKNNYGNRLQNYAVQKVLESLNCDVDTIENTTLMRDYDNLKLKLKYTIGNIYGKSRINNIKKLNKAWRYAKFYNFTKENIKTSKYKVSKDYVNDEIKKQYDYFICGSDQIWNPNFPCNSEVDFLAFADKGQRIAYAPSFGVSELPKDKEIQYKKLIEGIDHLSVREYAGAKIIKSLTGRDAIVLLDPTLMLSKQEWLKICKLPKWYSGKKYILTYFLGDKDSETEEKIKSIAKKNNLNIINILDISSKDIYSIDPAEFVALINNAELMCTDSFHGVVFSLIMKSPFIVFERKDSHKSMNSRLETLLSKFDMECRLDKNICNNGQVFNVDFENVDRIINNEKEKTFNYLKNALNIK